MPSESNPPFDFSRRGFLRNVWAWILGGAGMALSYPILSFIRFRVPPELHQVRVVKTVLPGLAHAEKDFVLFVDPGEKVWAVSRKCTHLGCRINFNAMEGLLVCPCHQSKFTREGHRVAGPARRNLPLFHVTPLAEAEGGGYIVTL